MKALLYLATILFAFFTCFQFNDAVQYGTMQPLVVLWIMAYGVTALSTFFTAIGKALPCKAHLSFAVLCFLCALVRAFDIDWSHSLIICHECNPAANETGGLLLLSVWHFYLFKKGFMKKAAP